MDIAQMRSRPHLSASGINAYLDCGLMYRFSRIDKLKPEFRSDALALGSCIHQALADMNQERMIGKIWPLEKLQDTFEAHLKESIPDANGMVHQGKALLAACYDEVAYEPFQILAIEEPFEFKLDGIDVPIIGIMDMVCEDPEGTVIIVDYKTAKKAFSADDVNRNFQMSLYHMAARANGYANREILLRLDCLIKTKSPKFEQYYTTRTQSDEQRVTKKIKEVWKGIQKGIFIPNDNSWKCSYCAYKQSCDAWFKGEIS